MNDITKYHNNITVSGRVQGVGYRYACRRMANTLGIKGFVKNLYNEKVYIEAEGTQIQLQQFISWCYQGPAHAQVSDIETEENTVIGFKYFDIKS